MIFKHAILAQGRATKLNTQK